MLGPTPEAGADAVEEGRFDLLAIGRPFIANAELLPYDGAMLGELC